MVVFVGHICVVNPSELYSTLFFLTNMLLTLSFRLIIQMTCCDAEVGHSDDM